MQNRKIYFENETIYLESETELYQLVKISKFNNNRTDKILIIDISDDEPEIIDWFYSTELYDLTELSVSTIDELKNSNLELYNEFVSINKIISR